MFNSISFEEETKRVLLTGFSTFDGLESNPSWEGVKAMNQEKIQCKYGIELCREEITVRYDHVDTVVPRLWENLKPHLTIHVGVSGAAPCFVLETQACKTGYIYGDENGNLPENNENVADGPEIVATDFEVEEICKEFNCSPPAKGLQADISTEAGRFLCEYIYYTSLCRGSNTLFVHVPHETYTRDEIALGLERILEKSLEQLQRFQSGSKTNQQEF